MGVGSFFGSIAGTVFKIGRIVLPILNAFRAASPEVDEYLDKVDDIIESGGEAADAFLDRNLGTLEDMQTFFSELEQLGADGRVLSVYLIEASQVESPETLTPVEAHKAGILLNQVRESFAALATKEELAEKIATMK